ncbi:hypothetical protein DPMN_078224 [Dreissena polymorpha]|uniref:Uncharacterized protein n=1 Tax=Dreissena polymorpha TaxID=45954 RepID=A0A9D3YQ60_DREPO|nr:hypothetical protein DPMN_078224 [Dreissena polymorpha]
MVPMPRQGELESVNELGADYLYQKDKMYDTSYDTGDKAIQCGRHNDVFKLWLMWRSKVNKFTNILSHVFQQLCPFIFTHLIVYDIVYFDSTK